MRSDAERRKQIEESVRFLCSPECAGRRSGSKQGAVAREWIIEAFERAKLSPVGDEAYTQKVPKSKGVNLIGEIEGAGDRKDRTVLVAAHYDHLGYLDGVPYPGADDNAAAIAILLDTAIALKARQEELDRTVIICAFDAEEPPFFLTSAMGSQFYVRNPHRPLDQIDMMICMDLLGHAMGPAHLPDAIRQSIFLLGAEKSEGTAASVNRTAERCERINICRLAKDVIPPLSDYQAFEEAQVPFLFLTCGRWEHYHSPTDTPDRLDYNKILATSDFLTDLVLDQSRRSEEKVEFRFDGRDDQTTLETLREMARLLQHVVPVSNQVAPMFESLERHLEKEGRFGPAEQQIASKLVSMMESVLS